MKKLRWLTTEHGRLISALSLFVPAIILDHLSAGSFSDPKFLASFVIYLAAYIIAGLPVFVAAVRGILRRDFLDEKFLMCIASVGAMIIGEMSEGVAVMLFFLLGEYFEHRAVARSRRSIKELMSICPDEACVIDEDGNEHIEDAEDVEIGSVIVVRAGERVPIDSVVLSGSADVDTSALTGESMPRSVDVNMTVESGSVVLNGVLKCRTVKLAEESSAARILELVENANENKSREESFITKFSRYYTPAVVILAVLMAVIPPLFTTFMSWDKSIYAALTFLVISCPCALVISVPMAFFGGIGGAASRGILFKGGNVFSSLARAETFAFDKTGTITTGCFKVGKIESIGMSEDELLYYAASAEYGSNHPVAECVRLAAKTVAEPCEYTEIPGRGVKATVDGKRVLVGNSRLLIDEGITPTVTPFGTSLFVAVENCFAGIIYLNDEIKFGAEQSIKRLAELGAKRRIMLSGDRFQAASDVAAHVGIEEVDAELLPDEKYQRVREMTSADGRVVYVGDGINDAPALAFADVGIAMGAIGSDSAIEAADVVIMSDDLARIPTAIGIARKTLRIAKANIVFALGVKLLVMLLGAVGLANMWLAVFADVGVAVLAILNSMRALKVKDF